MNCPFCHGPTTYVPYPRVDEDAERIKQDPRCDHYFQNRTCTKCQTDACHLSFNYMIHKDPAKSPELINYCLKHNGFTAWIGVKWPSTQITEDWHSHKYGSTSWQTMCHPILMSEDYSMSLTPENFPRRLKTILTFQ